MAVKSEIDQHPFDQTSIKNEGTNLKSALSIISKSVSASLSGSGVSRGRQVDTVALLDLTLDSISSPITTLISPSEPNI